MSSNINQLISQKELEKVPLGTEQIWNTGFKNYPEKGLKFDCIRMRAIYGFMPIISSTSQVGPVVKNLPANAGSIPR